MNSIELFSGAGGLAIGISQAGFKHQAMIELNKDACATVRQNQIAGNEYARNWPLYETDVCDFNYDSISGEVDLLAAGPPCQPFSLAGKHQGHKDHRNMFPEVFKAVLKLSPKAILIENVRGLGRESFSEYLEYILLQLRFPEISLRSEEGWRGHAKRLARYSNDKKQKGLSYKIFHKVLNAADFGVPQHRERLFIVGFRSDLKVDWKFPEPTHSFNSLIWDKWISGSYWKRHGIVLGNRESLPKNYRKITKSLEQSKIRPALSAWGTVRDAVSSLPNPKDFEESKLFLNHEFIPGARKYPGHTGSAFDYPAKTLKAGIHGVPGGENMLTYPNGKVRYFTIRECARLQTFPDNYKFSGAWSAATKQVGNAVPVLLCNVVAKAIASGLNKISVTKLNGTSYTTKAKAVAIRRSA